MKLFQYSMGSTEKYGVAKDEKDAYERRAEVDHTFDFTPVIIEEVTIPGYEIIVQPLEAARNTDIKDMNREQLKKWLDEREIAYFKGAKDEKLKELALQNV